MVIKNQILSSLQKATGIKDVGLEFSEKEEFGDYSSNIALVLAKKKKASPQKLAEEIAGKINKMAGLPAEASVKAGFINFRLSEEELIKNLVKIDQKYGSSKIGKNKTVVIDYSSPNIAKAFGIGHLRSTIIGQALYNLYKFSGYEVIGDNHLGDWGTQFGKLLYMIKTKKVTDFDIAGLEKLYVEFHQLAKEDPGLEDEARLWFKKLEDGDSQAREIWQKCVDVSLAEFERVYRLLGVKIDFAFGESHYEAQMKQLLENPLVLKHVIGGEGGAKIIDLSKEGISTPLMLLKADGGTTYATRDLATIAFRAKKWNPDIIIYEVGAEQALYFKQVFTAARLLGLVNNAVKFIHTAHGLYLAPDGKKFATREGKTVKLEEVLKEAVKRAEKLGDGDKKAARMVGIGAVKYFDLMHSVQSNVVFDWEKMMNLQGNSGPYLQYTVARTNSVLAKLKTQNSNLKTRTDNLKPNAEELKILRSLVRFPEIIATSAKNYSPNLLCNYLYDLASKFNSFYNKHRIIGSESENFRLVLTAAVGSILKTGLGLLGIETPEKM